MLILLAPVVVPVGPLLHLPDYPLSFAAVVVVLPAGHYS